MHSRIFVTYDGIENSVFQGQVLTPLLKQAEAHPVHLVSFERAAPSTEFLKKTHLKLYLFKRLPFLGTLSMLHSIYQLKKLLRQYDAYELTARGPLAAYVCLGALDARRCRSLTIQARGLLAEEYAYTHSSNRTPLHRWWHTWRAQALKKIEHTVYGRKEYPVPTAIEVVSPALGEYLRSTYGTRQEFIQIARNDIPPLITPTQKISWRKEIRQLLDIDEHAVVYCYNGSVKAWQCPEMTVTFFKQEWEKNRNSVLLLLTQDQEPFIQLLAASSLPASSYRLLTVEHHQIYRYLAASDAGIIFRTASVINWVSRPTKALEYSAVGLAIVHNNTVAMLCAK